MDFIHDSSLFESRIAGNYDLMGTEFGEEELLHLLTTPPEIYIAEGGVQTTLGQTFLSSRHEEQLSIINNVLNRIMISGNASLTYQDRAFITDVLYKLGIRDDKRFMAQVYRSMRQVRDERRFLELYLTEGLETKTEGVREELRSLVRELSLQKDETEPYRNDLYLSSRILNRLETAELYQMVASFQKNIFDNHSETSEFTVSEQLRSSEALLREAVNERISVSDRELIYREEQEESGEAPFEVGTLRERIRETSEEKSTVTERMTEGAASRTVVRTEETIVPVRERPEAELIYRTEEISEREEGQGQGVTPETPSEPLTVTERVREPAREQEAGEPAQVTEESPEQRTEYHDTELIFRTEEALRAAESTETEPLAPSVMQRLIENQLRHERERIREGSEPILQAGTQTAETNAFIETEMIYPEETAESGAGSVREETPAMPREPERVVSEREIRDRERIREEVSRLSDTTERILAGAQPETIRSETVTERVTAETGARSEERTEYRETELIHKTEILPGDEGAAGAEATVPPASERVTEVSQLLQRERIREAGETVLPAREGSSERAEFRETEIVYQTPEGEPGAETISAEEPLQPVEREVRISGETVLDRERTQEEMPRILDRERSVRESALYETLRSQSETERAAFYTDTRTAERTDYRETELIHRTEVLPGTESETAEASIPAAVTRNYQYISQNIYEQELGRGTVPGGSVTEEINAAVFLDVVRNLYRSELDNSRSRSMTALSFVNALQNISGNTLIRLNRITSQEIPAGETLIENLYEQAPQIFSPFGMPEQAAGETGETPEEAAASAPSLEEQLIRLNERNLQNVANYQQMMQLFESLNMPEEAGGGPERTRKEALAALTGGKELLEAISGEENRQEQKREQVFREIERLFPNDTAQVFNLTRQFIENPGAALENVTVMRNNLAEAANELQRVQEQQRSAPPPVIREEEPEAPELIHRRRETMTPEEIEELVENVSRVRSREISQTEQSIELREQSTETRQQLIENRQTVNLAEQDEIAAMIARGVRSQVNAISEEVLHKLEKRLRNEKSRRGI
ncbi:MAG: hypothetical protein K6G83_11435 [Lachnospiraceae bacterium]|nr:hypothetical protein [Lachnospiraceae bacterium]